MVLVCLPRTQQGCLHKAYLGKSGELTSERLEEVVARLTTTTGTASNTQTQHISSLPLPPGATPSVIAANAHLLTTKFHIPTARPNIVSRPRLIEQLNAGLRSKLTLIVAPAGWGKTTLLAPGMLRRVALPGSPIIHGVASSLERVVS